MEEQKSYWKIKSPKLDTDKDFSFAAIEVKSDFRFIFSLINKNSYIEQKEMLNKGLPHDKYEIVCNDIPKIQKRDKELFYISKEKGKALRTLEIDELLIVTIIYIGGNKTDDVNDNIEELTEFLNYQLEKYDNKKERLNHLLTLFDNYYKKNISKYFINDNWKLIIGEYQPHCIRWANNKLKEIEKRKEEFDDKYEPLFKDLRNTYITKIEYQDFAEIIKYKRLPNNVKPYKWAGSKADAGRFAICFDFSISQFKKCFDTGNVKLHNKYFPKHENTHNKLYNILLKHNFNYKEKFRQYREKIEARK